MSSHTFTMVRAVVNRLVDLIERHPKMTLAAFVVMSLMTACSAIAQPAPTNFRLCTGSDAGNYFRAGHVLKSRVTSVRVEVVSTQGSLDNLDRVLKGDCDGAFVQSDSLLVYSSRNAQALSGIERAGVLYQEQVHLLCNRSAGVSDVSRLGKAHTVAIGPDGSGARTTWDAFVLANRQQYGQVNTDTRSGVRALSAIADGSQVQCMLWVGAMGSSFMKNDAQQHGDRMMLVGTADRKMINDAKDNRGRAVYSYGEIPSGVYPRIQPSGAMWGTKALDTIQVDALFIASTAWIGANERPYDAILRGFSAAKPQILELVTPK